MNISFFFSFAYGGNEIPSQLGAQDQNNEEILFIEYDRCESIFKSSMNHDSTLIIYSFFPAVMKSARNLEYTTSHHVKTTSVV